LFRRWGIKLGDKTIALTQMGKRIVQGGDAPELRRQFRYIKAADGCSDVGMTESKALFDGFADDNLGQNRRRCHLFLASEDLEFARGNALAINGHKPAQGATGNDGTDVASAMGIEHTAHVSWALTVIKVAI
jgi:hypothetical protein